jgi:hypothetical protein
MIDFILNRFKFILMILFIFLKNKSLSCKKLTLREVNLLKVVLSCGLYPQVAIADEFNSYKRDSDQYFHSKVILFKCLCFFNCYVLVYFYFVYQSTLIYSTRALSHFIRLAYFLTIPIYYSLYMTALLKTSCISAQDIN